MIEGQRVTFTSRMQVDLAAYQFDEAAPKATEILIQTEYSAISSGTELALLSNNQDIDHWQGEPYPAHPGYAAVGQVIACGEDVRGLVSVTESPRHVGMRLIIGSIRVRRW